MSTDLDKPLEDLVKDVLGTALKFGVGLYAAWNERAENPRTEPEPEPERDIPAPPAPQRPTGRQPANPGSYLPAHFKTGNDNGVRRISQGWPQMIGECRGNGVITVDKAFVGDHSLTHTLRFAAHLVRATDLSEDYEDFFRVLNAVEDAED